MSFIQLKLSLLVIIVILPFFLWSSVGALDSCMLAIQHYEKDTLSLEYAELLYKTGKELVKNEQYSKAEQYHTRSMKIGEIIGNRQIILQNTIRLGVVAYWSVKNEQAIAFFNTAISDYPDVINSTDSATIYQVLSDVYYEMGKTYLSYQTILKALEVEPRLGDKGIMANSYYALARVNVKQKQ